MITKTEPTTASTTLAQDTRFRLLLCGILIAAYMLVYVDVPATIDGKATLAVTSSLLKYGTPDINVIGSAEGLLPPMARMGSFGQDGLLYAKKGITPSLFLLPFVQLAHIIPFLPVRATAMLLNPVVTTLTALLLYTFARWIHYPPRTAFVTALTYGLGTFAVVYTLTLFGEPLAAFLLLSALMAGYYYRQSGDFRALMIAGAALGLAVGVNLSYGVMAPLIGVYAFGLDPRRWRLLQLTAMILPFSLLFVLLLAYNLARFGSLLQSGYHFAEGEGFTSPFWIGIIGLILSPYRGFFWYNPVMLLAVPGALLFRRRNLPLLSIILALTAAQIITYASWWSWHGGVVWGPRFLIPITPLLALLLLPVIDRVPQQHLLAAIFILLGGFSLLIQAAASFFRVIPFVEFQLDTSPIIAQFQLALSGEALHPALFRNSDLIHAVLLLSALAAGILGFHYA
ncbi:MAG TPA: hypothetical protein VKY59_14575, partial [Spirillospora sp.]|nr:hypothetical protein [Spirillospora sp.]